MQKPKPPDRTKLIVTVVAGALVIAALATVGDNPVAMHMLTGRSASSSPVGGRDPGMSALTTRGQPIAPPQDRVLREEERRGLEWMSVAPLPPLPDLQAVPASQLEPPGPGGFGAPPGTPGAGGAVAEDRLR